MGRKDEWKEEHEGRKKERKGTKGTKGKKGVKEERKEHGCIYVCMCVYVSMYMYACIYAFMYVCICVFVFCVSRPAELGLGGFRRRKEGRGYSEGGEVKEVK